MSELATIQQWLTSIIVRPGRLSEKIRMADDHYCCESNKVIRASDRLSVEQKIEIYSRGYLLRLLECMEAEFPALCVLLGADLFNTFVKAYLMHLPPNTPDLFNLGERFPEFLKATQPLNNSNMVTMLHLPLELAMLERAIAETSRIAGLEEDRGGSDSLNDKSLSLFDTAGIKTSPCLKLIKSSFALVEFVKGVYHNNATINPEQRETYIAISRTNYRVVYQELDQWQWRFLDNLQIFDSYIQAVSACAEQCSIRPDVIISDLMLWQPIAIYNGFIYKSS